MKKLLLKSMVVLALLASHAYAQNRTITGTVTGTDDGTPIPGASIVIKGTKIGTQTSPTGKFTITVGPGPQSLIVSFIGYLTKTVPVEGAVINVALSPNQKALTEVVVVGYGTQKKQDVVGSIASISGKDLIEQPVQNFEQSLAGKASGVQITIPNGVLNTPPVFHIRGTNSISLSSQPLIVVDGIAAYTGDVSGGESGGNTLANINPDDIESIDILKDASATAIYGSRGANGVVILTTKKGKKGSAVVSLDSWYGITKPFRLPQVLDAFQYVALKNEALTNFGYNLATTYTALATGPDGNPINTDWEKLIYRDGSNYNTSASISGANEKTSYYFSAFYTKQSGVLQKNDLNNKGILINIDHKPNKYISFGGKISYSDNQNLAATSSGSLAGEAYATGGLGREAVLLPPNLGPVNNDGSYNLSSTGALGTMADKGISISYTNPLVALDLDRANNEIYHTVGNVYFQLSPFPWMSLKTIYGIDYINSVNDAFNNPVSNFSTVAGVVTNAASATDSYVQYKRSVWTNTANFDHTFGKHSLSLLLGNEQQQSNTTGFGESRSILSDPSFNIIQAGFTTTTASGNTIGKNYLVSFFGRFSYDFDKRYYLSATLRKDGYSAFGSDSKYGYFPSLGLAWSLSQEKFWEAAKLDRIFSSFKIKGSWGRVGNNNGLGDFASYGTYGTSVYNGQPTLSANATGNNNLAWETSTKTDIGLSFGILKERITADLGVYKNDITGLIFPYQEPPSAGLPSQPSVNIGSMYNKGIEFNVDAEVLHSKNFRWNSNFNVSYNINEITALIPGVSYFTYSTSSLETASINQVGFPVGNLWIVRSAGVDPTTGLRIFVNGQGKQVMYNFIGNKYLNMDGTPYVATSGIGINQNADAVNYGNTTPKVVGGFSNNFHYKGFDLNVLLTYQLGFYVYYGTQATLTDQRFWNNSTLILDHWTTPGQVATYPKVVFGDNVSNGTSYPADFNVYSGNFVKVKTINFGYTLPHNLLSKAGISSLRLYVTGQNLFVFTKYPGPDPEVSSNGTGNSNAGVDRNTAANGRTFTAGFSVKF